MRAHLIAWVVCAVAHSARADAQDDNTKAEALYVEGKRHFDLAQYGPAIASWKASYLLSSASLLLFNIGQAYRLSGNCAEANRFYLNYKRVEPKPSNRVELEVAMKKCKGVAPATGDATDPEPVSAKPDDKTIVADPPGEEPAIATKTEVPPTKVATTEPVATVPDVIVKKPATPTPRPSRGLAFAAELGIGALDRNPTDGSMDQDPAVGTLVVTIGIAYVLHPNVGIATRSRAVIEEGAITGIGTIGAQVRFLGRCAFYFGLGIMVGPGYDDTTNVGHAGELALSVGLVRHKSTEWAIGLQLVGRQDNEVASLTLNYEWW